MNDSYHKMEHDMRKMIGIWAIPVFCVLIFGGCKVGPNYHPSEPNAPGQWIGRMGEQNVSSPDANLVNWWTQFNDPNLTSLIDRAIASNLDLKLAKERIRQARAQAGVVSSGFWPSVNATASATRSRNPGIGSAPARTSNLFSTGLDSIWELDIFGGTRRAIEAAKADVTFAVEDRRDVLVSLVSEVAINYVHLRTFQQQVIIAQDNLKSQQHSAEIVSKRFENGFASRLDLVNSQSQVATTLAQIPLLEAAVQQTIYSLDFLLGLEPGALGAELSPVSLIPVAPPSVPQGLPSDIIRRRPDIRRAEASIHGATARIGVAVANLFPKFNLIGRLDFSGSGVHAVNWDNRAWSVGPSADWQIFSAGQVRSNIEVRKALQKQSMIIYRQSVLSALNEVENSLVAYAKELQRNRALADAVELNRKAVEISLQLYSEGQTDYINVINAQRSLFVSEEAYAQSNRDLSTDIIALYKALGGGWDITADDE